jgi:predicted outer membrane repeat protein
MSKNYRPRVESLEDRCVPATITVTKLTDGVGVSGMTLREAVDKANLTPASDKIVFKTGLKGTINLDALLGEIDITTSLKIIGPGANKITISGQDASRIFSLDDGTGTAINVTLSKLTLTRGNGTGTLFSGTGGAIFSNGENLTLNNVTLSHNHTTGIGGAIVSALAPTLTVNQSRLFGNSSDSSGGAINASGTVVVRNSLLSANHAILAGGAILAATGADVTVENSTV